METDIEWVTEVYASDWVICELDLSRSCTQPLLLIQLQRYQRMCFTFIASWWFCYFMWRDKELHSSILRWQLMLCYSFLDSLWCNKRPLLAVLPWYLPPETKASYTGPHNWKCPCHYIWIHLPHMTLIMTKIHMTSTIKQICLPLLVSLIQIIQEETMITKSLSLEYVASGVVLYKSQFQATVQLHYQLPGTEVSWLRHVNLVNISYTVCTPSVWNQIVMQLFFIKIIKVH